MLIVVQNSTNFQNYNNRPMFSPTILLNPTEKYNSYNDINIIIPAVLWRLSQNIKKAYRFYNNPKNLQKPEHVIGHIYLNIILNPRTKC